MKNLRPQMNTFLDPRYSYSTNTTPPTLDTEHLKVKKEEVYEEDTLDSANLAIGTPHRSLSTIAISIAYPFA